MLEMHRFSDCLALNWGNQDILWFTTDLKLSIDGQCIEAVYIRTRQGMTSTGFAMFSIWYLLLKIVKPISTINELFGLDLFLPAANFYFCPWFVIFSFLYFYTFLILPCRSQSERAGDYVAILPCTVPIRSQLGIICPVGFTLSVFRQWTLSASEWRCITVRSQCVDPSETG